MLIRKLLYNASIYSFASILTTAIAFFLLPLYTSYLTPSDYGIVALVFSINSFLTIVFNFSLRSAVSRYYFEYKENPRELASFWGSVFTFIFLFSVLCLLLLFWLGDSLFHLVLGEVSFYPHIALGLGIVFFEQFYSILIIIFQTRGQAWIYGVFTIVVAVFNILLTIYFIVYLKLGATGVLLGSFTAYVVAFLFFIVILRKDFRIGINRFYLRQALKYAMPLIPHEMSSNVQQILDKLFINQMISTAATGLYDIGFKFGYIISILGVAVSRSYAPAVMQAMKNNDNESMRKLQEIAYLIIGIFCSIGLTISLFAREIVVLFTDSSFHESYSVIPFVAFNFVALGFYYIFVAWLFFHGKNIKYVSAVSLLSGLINGFLNFFLIKLLGIEGAALATLFTSLCMVILVAVLVWHKLQISWSYPKIVIVFVFNLIIAVLFNALHYEDYFPSQFSFLLIKFIVLIVAVSLSFSILVKGNPLKFLREES